MIDSFSGEHRFLSNFWLAPVWYDGVVYPSVEHAYQAAKTLDPDEREMILEAPTPGRAKQLGRKVRLRAGWEESKIGVMLDLLRQKFGQYPELQQQLLATGEQELIEGNYWGDRYWGVCEGSGRNALGKLLMQVRAELAVRS